MIIYSPIPGALKHYADALRGGLPQRHVSLIEVDGEGRTGIGKVAALLRHVWCALTVGRRGTKRVVVVWPLLGWLDLVLWMRRRSPVYVVVHDPVPLRHQIGLGRWSETIARLLLRFGTTNVVCHSEDAAREVRSRFPRIAVTVLPHPFIADPIPRKPSSVVTVLGQYKPARDLQLLERIGPQLRSAGFEPRITGRGWPAIPGWTVTDRFLSEDELEAELQNSAALVLPYSYYFQSGVAVRALECGTPVVGLATDFLVSLVGDAYPGLVRVGSDSEWVEATKRAAHSSHPAATSRDIETRTVEAWQRWLPSAA